MSTYSSINGLSLRIVLDGTANGGVVSATGVYTGVADNSDPATLANGQVCMLYDAGGGTQNIAMCWLDASGTPLSPGSAAGGDVLKIYLANGKTQILHLVTNEPISVLTRDDGVYYYIIPGLDAYTPHAVTFAADQAAYNGSNTLPVGQFSEFTITTTGCTVSGSPGINLAVTISGFPGDGGTQAIAYKIDSGNWTAITSPAATQLVNLPDTGSHVVKLRTGQRVGTGYITIDGASADAGTIGVVAPTAAKVILFGDSRLSSGLYSDPPVLHAPVCQLRGHGYAAMAIGYGGATLADYAGGTANYANACLATIEALVTTDVTDFLFTMGYNDSDGEFDANLATVMAAIHTENAAMKFWGCAIGAPVNDSDARTAAILAACASNSAWATAVGGHTTDDIVQAADLGASPHLSTTGIDTASARLLALLPSLTGTIVDASHASHTPPGMLDSTGTFYASGYLDSSGTWSLVGPGGLTSDEHNWLSTMATAGVDLAASQPNYAPAKASDVKFVANITPGFVGPASQGNVNAGAFKCYANSRFSVTFPVLDSSGNPINLTSYSGLRAAFADPNSLGQTAFAATVGGTHASVTAGGTNGNMVTLTLDATITATARNLEWILGDEATKQVFTQGTLNTQPFPAW